MAADFTTGRARKAARGLAAYAEGMSAETLAADYLKGRKFTILAQRLRTAAGEIDLIAANRTLLLFIEVKSRASLYDAAFAISPRQSKRLLDAAALAMALHPDWLRPQIRFDAILIAGTQIQVIEDAIRAD